MTTLLTKQQRYNTNFRQDHRGLGHPHDAFSRKLDGYVITRPLGQVAHMTYPPLDNDLAVLLMAATKSHRASMILLNRGEQVY